MADENTTNLDITRPGRKHDILAQEYATKVAAKADDDDFDEAWKQAYQGKLDELTRAHNAGALASIPASNLLVTDENRDEMVTRYRLKAGKTKEDVKDVVRRRNALIESAEYDGDEAQIKTILSSVFDVQEMTVHEAATNRDWRRNPSNFLEDQKKPIIAQSSGIPADALCARLFKQGKTIADLAKMVGVHHKTAESWTNNGVPEDHAEAVSKALK